MASPAAALSILITVNSRRVTPELAKLDRQLASFAKTADRATKVQADVQTRPLESGLAKATGKIKAFGAQKATVKADVDTTSIEEKMRRASGVINRELGSVSQQLDRWSRTRASAKVDVDTGEVERKIASSRGMLAALPNRVEVKVDADTDPMQRSLASAQRSLMGFNRSVLTTRNMVKLIAPPALITALGLATNGIAGLSAAAVGLVGALVPAAAALAAYPALLGAIGQGFGVFKLATGGIADALKAYTDQQSSASKASSQAAGALKREMSGQKQVEGAVKAASAALEQQHSAVERVRQAKVQLTDAQRGALTAQRALTEARREARRNLEDMQLAAKHAALGEQSATLALARARQELTKTMRDPKASRLDVEEAQLAVRQAQQGVEDSRLEARRARADATDARKKGVEGSSQVVAANEQVRQSHQGVADAQRGVIEAQRDLRRAQVGVAEANRAIAETQKQVAVSAAAVTPPVNKFAEAMKKLPPATRQFAQYLVTLIPRLKDLQGVAAAGLLPGAERGLRAAMANFGVVRGAVAQTARVMGQFAAKAGEALGSRVWGRDLAAIAGTNARVLGLVGDVMLSLADAFRNVMVAARPFVLWMTRGVASFAAYVARSAEAGRQTGRLAGFFDRARQSISVLVAIGRNLGSVLLSIFSAARPLGMELLRAFAGVTQKWAAFLESTRGQNSLAKFFNDAKPTIYATAKLIGALATSFFEIGRSESIAPLIDKIRNELLPVLTQTVAGTTAAFGPHLVNLLVQVVKLIGNLAGTSGPLTLYVDLLAALAKGANMLFAAVPGLQSATIALIGLSGVMKVFGLTLKFLYPDTLIAVATGFTAAVKGQGIAAEASGAKLVGYKVAMYATAAAQRAYTAAVVVFGTAFAAIVHPIAAARAALITFTAAEVAAAAAARAHPFVAAATALIFLGTAFVIAYKKSETFRNAVNKYGPIVLALISPLAALGFAVVRLVQRFQWMQTTLRAIWTAMKATATFVFGAIKAVILASVGSTVGWVLAKLRGFATTVKGIWGAMKTAASTSWGLIKAAIIQPAGSAAGWVIGRLDSFKKTLTGIWGAIKTGAAKGWAAIGDAIVSPIKNAVQGVIGFINAIIKAINHLPGVDIKPLATGGGGAAKTGKAIQGAGAAPGFAVGGVVNKPMAIVGEEAPRHPEYVIATNPRYRQRNQKLAAQAAGAVGLPGYAEGGRIGQDPEQDGKRLFPKGQRIQSGIMPGFAKGGTVLAKLISEANKIDAKHYPYVWGGGHDPNFTPPYDCSGAVSAILHAAGLLASPRVSGALMGYGGGRGQGAATIFANPGHVFMSLAGKGWGTGSSNPGGGAGWLPYSSRSGFAVSHIKGVGNAAGMVPGAGGADGGILPTIGGILGKIGGLPKALAGGAAKLSSGLIKKGLSPLVSKLPDWVQGFGRWAVDKVANFIPSMVKLPSGDAGVGARSGGAGRGQMVKWAKMALQATGLSPGGGNVESLLTLAQKESGWVTDSINLWDSNAKAGNPSVGLMQVTLDKVGGSKQRGFDPVQNMIASIKYQMGRYGRLITFSPYAEGGILGLQKGGALAPKQKPKGKPKKRGKPFDALQLFGMWGRAQTTEIPTSIRDAVERFSGQAGFAGEMADRAQTLGVPVQGLDEMGWLQRQLGALGALRNQLVQAYQAAMQRRAMLSKMLEQLQAQLRKLQEERKQLLERVKRQEKALAAAKKQVPSKLLPRDRRRQAAVTAAQTALDQTKARLTNVNETLGGMPKAIGDVRKRRDGLAESGAKSLESLGEVQGAYGPITLLPRLPEIGALGGSIFQVQARIADLSKPAETAQDVSTGVGDDNAAAVAEQQVALLQQLLREANVRAAVSERQFATLRALPPFGGSFATGGVVPGPGGAPRMVVAHGGETITPAGQGTVTVVVNGDITNVPAGRDPVEVVLNDRRFAVAVERATRPAGRSADRRLPSSRSSF